MNAQRGHPNVAGAPPLGTVRAMRPGLAVALACAIGLSGWALLSSPENPVPLVVATGAEAVTSALGLASSVVVSVLPTSLPAVPWDRAEHDPFQGPPVPPTTATPPIAPPPVVPAALPSPVAPPPPQMGYTFIGRMRSPEGQVLVLLSNGADMVVATPGAALDNGHVVESLAENAVLIGHRNLPLRLSLPIPQLSEFEGPAHGSTR